MGWSKTSFMEGAIAGAITGAGAGVITAPETAGLSIPIFTIIGTIIGALIKIKILQAFFLIAGIYLFGKLEVFPPYMIFIFIIVMIIWIIGGMKK